MSAHGATEGQWALIRAELAADRSVHGRSELDRIRRETFAEDLAHRVPLGVPRGSRIDVFCDLVATAFTRQAGLLARGGPSGAAAGAFASQCWVEARGRSATAPSAPADAVSFIAAALESVTASPTPGDWLTDVTALVLWGWRTTIAPSSVGRRSGRAHLRDAASSAARASVEILDTAIEIDLPHWHAGPDCGCDESHAWLAPLVGWLEVLVTDLESWPAVDEEGGR